MMLTMPIEIVNDNLFCGRYVHMCSEFKRYDA